MRRMIFGFGFLALLLGGTGEVAADFIYDIQNYPSLQNGFTLSGTITTDIDTGTLSGADIKAWTITITPAVGSGTTFDSTMSGSNVLGTNGVDVSPTAITLSAGVLTFNDAVNFSPLQYNRGANNLYISKPDGNTTNWFDFLGPTALGGDPWIIATAETSATPAPSTLVMSSILFGMFGTVWSYKRLKQGAVAA
jgi:hypothetical protein